MLFDRIKRRLRDGERPIRFVLAGAVNTGVGLTLFPALLWISPYLHDHYMIGLVVSQVICVFFAFAIYKFTVFKTRANIFQEFWYFSSFYYATFAANLLVLPLLVQGGGLPPIPAQLAFTFVTIIGSYLWHSHVTFRSNRNA